MPSCRKIVKGRENGKYYLRTRIARVKFVESTAGTIKISFVDPEGSSIMAKFWKDSKSASMIKSLLRGKKLLHSIPEYPQTFSYDVEPFIGLWVSGKIDYEDVSSEYELGYSSLGKAGIHTKFTVINPRVLPPADTC